MGKTTIINGRRKRNDWYEGWESGAETLELAGEDFDSRKIEDIEIFEE